MKYFKKSESLNIYLSSMNVDDINQYTKWMNDIQVTNNLGSTRVTTLLNEKERLKQNSSKREYQFAIVSVISDTSASEIRQMLKSKTYSSINFKKVKSIKCTYVFCENELLKARFFFN